MRAVLPYLVQERVQAELFTVSPRCFFLEVRANEPQHGLPAWQLAVPHVR
jgi:hypothetical protein